MTRTEALPEARRLAAAACAIDGCTEDYCAFMRDGAYDDSREVQSALAGLVNGHRMAKRTAKESAPSLVAVSA